MKAVNTLTTTVPIRFFVVTDAVSIGHKDPDATTVSNSHERQQDWNWSIGADN